MNSLLLFFVPEARFSPTYVMIISYPLQPALQFLEYIHPLSAIVFL